MHFYVFIIKFKDNSFVNVILSAKYFFITFCFVFELFEEAFQLNFLYNNLKMRGKVVLGAKNDWNLLGTP